MCALVRTLNNISTRYLYLLSVKSQSICTISQYSLTRYFCIFKRLILMSGCNSRWFIGRLGPFIADFK